MKYKDIVFVILAVLVIFLTLFSNTQEEIYVENVTSPLNYSELGIERSIHELNLTNDSLIENKEIIKKE